MLIKQIAKIVIAGAHVFLVLFLAACASSPLSEIDKIREGMNKQEVLAKAGSPDRTRFKNEKDEWSYIIRDRNNHATITREIHFFNGHVVYVGGPIPPRISAEDQDNINLQNHLNAMAAETKFQNEMQSRKAKILNEIYGEN